MENQKFRNKYIAPKVEQCIRNHKYSFSYSPPDDRSSITLSAKNDTVTKRDLSVLINLHLNCFKTKLRSCYIELYPELSPTGRLHYHGYITIKNVIDFYYRDLYYIQQKGTYEIDSIKDQMVWLKYITKQQPLFQEYFDGYKARLAPYIMGKPPISANEEGLQKELDDQEIEVLEDMPHLED